MGFINVVGWLIVLIPVALGVSAAAFLAQYSVPITVIVWGGLFIIVAVAVKGESDPHERGCMIAAPFAFLPCYALVICSLPGLLSQTGLRAIVAIVFELPLSALVAFLIGDLVLLAAMKLKEPEMVVSVSVIGNVLVTAMLLGIGV